MHDWLTIEFVLATLIVTSFTCVGLLALWAATSPRHWFLRAAVVLGALAPLLLIPAHEPFVAFILQCVVVAVGVIAYRRPPLAQRFSLSTLLLMMVVMTVTVPIAIRLPRLNLYAWTSVVLNGLGAGMATLIAAWLIVSPRKWIAWSLGLVGCFAIGTILSFFDWFVPSFVDWVSWPPEPSTSATVVFGMGKSTHPIVSWFFIPILVASVISFLAIRWRAAIAQTDVRSEVRPLQTMQWSRIATRASFAFLITLVATFPLYVLSKLLNPDPIPQITLPNPNGYDDLVQAATMLSTTQFNASSFEYETATQRALVAELAKCREAFDRLALGLSRSCQVPVDYLSQDVLAMTASPLRELARTLAGEAWLAEIEGRYDDAAKRDLQAIEFGQAISNGGLLIHSFVGFACSGFGTHPLYRIREKISADEADDCIAILIKVDATDEAFDDVMSRDRVWSQHAYGWHGHLQLLLDDMGFGRSFFFQTPDSYRHTFSKHSATIRMLIAELALAQYRKRFGRSPESLEELVPKFLPSIPLDPYDRNGLPLKYAQIDGTGVVYCIGANGIDDGGRSPAPDDAGWTDFDSDGDFRSDIYFADAERQDQATRTAAGESDANDTNDSAIEENPFGE